MVAEDIAEMVDRWLTTGSPSDTDREPLKQAHYELVGDPGERCRTCPSYWADLLHDLRVHLKTLGFTMINHNQEYMISPGAGYLEVHGLPYAYINKGSGPETASAKHLTDEIAIRLLTENPERAAVIVKNPEYVPKGEAGTGGAGGGSEDDPNATLTPQQKRAKTIADNKAKAERDAAEALALKDKAEKQAADALASQAAAKARASATNPDPGNSDPGTPSIIIGDQDPNADSTLNNPEGGNAPAQDNQSQEVVTNS